MKKFNAFLLTCMVVGSTVLGQTKTDGVQKEDFHNSIYIGYLGDNSFFGINYERFFMVNNHVMMAGKVGLAYNEIWSIGRRRTDRGKKLATVPHYLTINYRSTKNFFETGIGGLVADSRYIPIAIVGYRVHPLKTGRLNFRANISFPITEELSFLYIPFGLSCGIVF